MYAHAHVHRTGGLLLDVLDRLDHRQAHVDAEDGVVRTFLGRATDAVVAVAQDLYAQLLVPVDRKARWKKN